MGLSAEEKALRRFGIGSSESAGIAGIPSFSKPIDVFQSKTVPGFEVEQTFLMKMGNLLEDDNCDILAEREGVRLVRPDTWKHPTLPIVDSTDRIAAYRDGSTAPVEAKLVMPWNAQEFGEEGTDEVPMYCYSQCQHHLWARRQQGFNEAHCLVPVLVGLTEWRLYVVPWDKDLADTLIAHSLAFWEKHVVPRIPPPPDDSKSYTEYLAQKYPKPQKIVVKAPTDAELAAQAYLKAKTASDAAEKSMREAANVLRNLMQDAEGMAGQGWDATWRADKNGKRSFTVKASAA